MPGVIAPIRNQCDGPRARPARPATRDPNGIHQQLELTYIVALACRKMGSQWHPACVTNQVDLGGQTTSGASEGLIGRLIVVGSPFFEASICGAPAAARLARMLVESIIHVA